jgi:pyruvate,water dikinase
MYVKPLERVEKTDRTAGGKALSLSMMLKERMPVPPGFVVSSEGLALFLKRNRLEEKIRGMLEGLDVEDYRRLSEVSNGIRNLFVSSEIPENLRNEVSSAYESLLVSREAKEVGGAALDFIKAGREQTNVSVRSSPLNIPDSPFTGQAESLLNVQGLGSLLESLKLCWSSLYTPGAIYYRKKRDLPDIALAGVVIQKMVNSEKSGSVFTDNSNIIVEGTWGLGNAIANGVILPDVYLLDRETGKETGKIIGKKLWIYTRDPVSGKTKKEPVMREKVGAQLLDGEELRKIFELHGRVSSLYTEPKVMEWGVERGRIFLIQARPFLTKEAGGQADTESKPLAEGLNVSHGYGKGVIRAISSIADFDRISEGDIIVTKILSPELLPFFGKISGIISDYGGYTSSLSFMCREFGIPCATGVDTSSLNDGEVVGVSNGRVYPTGSPPETGSEEDAGITATEIKVNLDFSKTFDLEKEVDGVGLLKPDDLFAGMDPFSLSKNSPEELVERFHGIGFFAEKFYPKPVWYRSFSVRTDEVEGEWREKNPLLGWRGIRRSLEEPEILGCEIEAIRRLYSQGLNNIGIILSFVSSVDEFRSVKNLIPFSIKLGVEVCTPSSALDIESFCREGVNNVLVNLSELTQLTLGVDRTNMKVSSIYSESSPSVMRLIENIVKVCRNYNVEVSVSIERYDPYILEKLIRMGVNSISLDPEFIEAGKNMVSRTERKILLERTRGES